jgi:hypothetical protein
MFVDASFLNSQNFDNGSMASRSRWRDLHMWQHKHAVACPAALGGIKPLFVRVFDMKLNVWVE